MTADGCAARSDGGSCRRHLDAQHTLLQLLPSDSGVPAIWAADGRPPLRHVQLARFLGSGFPCSLREQLFAAGLPSLRDATRRPTMGLVLPNGPELGVALLGVMCWATCVPANADAPAEEVAAELRAAGVEAAIIAPQGPGQDNLAGSLSSALARAGIAVLHLATGDASTPAGLFDLRLAPTPHSMPAREGVAAQLRCCERDDVVLLLHTSGTSGAKKLVPYTLGTLAGGAACVAGPWALSPADVCLNMMPLSHAGGIVRNLLAPLLAGGGTLLTTGFDARRFWDLLLLPPDANTPVLRPTAALAPGGSEAAGGGGSSGFPTWYYAAPTMHAMILQEYGRRMVAAQASGSATQAVSSAVPAGSSAAGALQVAAGRLRLVANAAGPLLPSLAVRLKDVFRSAAVLPCYGLTECMPVATPPLDYTLDRPGTSGQAAGPQLTILDPSTGARLPTGVTGAICVRGPPTFPGYYRPPPAAVLGGPGLGPSAGGGIAISAGGGSETGAGGGSETGAGGGSETGAGGGSETGAGGGSETGAGGGSETGAGGGAAISAGGGAAISACGEIIPAALLPGGWFDTGDLGWMDAQGWLYVTGRGKEVINRGGEVIAPTEVEDALASLPQLHSCIAFSVAHEVLQEVVGVAVVVAQGAARPSLLHLHSPLAGRLHPSKWPQLLVYIDRLPLTASNKLQRVRLAERLSLPCIDDATPTACRLFQATAPPPGTPGGLSPIPCCPVDVEAEAAAAARKLLALSQVADVACAVERGGVAAYVQPAAGASVPPLGVLVQHLEGNVSGYVIPTRVVAVPSISRTPDGQLHPDWPAWADALTSARPRSATEQAVCAVWAEVLDTDPVGISADDNFFALGGSSMAVGEATALLRKRLGQPLLQAATMYQYPTLAGLAAALEKDGVEGADGTGGHAPLPKLGWSQAPPHDEPCSSTRPMALLLQALPLLVFYPAKRVSIVMLFAICLAAVRKQAGESMSEGSAAASVFQVVLAAGLVSVITAFVKPLLGISIKWLVIGRYRQGSYPLWGGHYLRRQLVQQLAHMLGLGVFSLTPWLVAAYHRLMGARIGWGVRIHKGAEISEWDLVSIGDGSALDRCVVRPFALAPGRMLLQPIALGRGCCVCLKSVVAPGAVLGDGASIGPVSSSHEAAADPTSLEATRRVCRVLFPDPHWAVLAFAALPLLAAAAVIGAVPQLAVLHALVSSGGLGRQATTVQGVLLWLSSPRRYPWALGLAVVRAVACPFSSLGAAILIKRCVLGRFEEGAAAGSQMNLLRSYVMRTLLPGGALLGVPQLLSPNVSQGCLLRALGAKVGQRIFWPGSGLDVVEYDLLEIGDDVVFGSRSAVLCGDAHGAARVVIGAGSMVADRCVLMPGARVGRGAVVGSGTLLPAGFRAPPGSCWLGSRHGGPVPWTAAGRQAPRSPPASARGGSQSVAEPHLHPQQPERKRSESVAVALLGGEEGDGDAAVGMEETLTPFGRGFHLRQAPYYVWPVWLHICYNLLARAAAALVWMAPLITTLAAVHNPHLEAGILRSCHCGGCIWRLWLAALPRASVSFGITCVMVLALTNAAQQLIVGNRQPGSYDWDRSDYQQRWQLAKAVQSLRMRVGAGHLHGLLDFLHGSAYLVWYFRALGARIGSGVCLYPNGADPMMTEPDLVEIGNGAAVDDASLVAHLNTKGHFTLHCLRLGEGCVVRTASRLLSGSSMEPHSALLEHTLVVSGDVVPEWTAWQGWPAQGVRQLSLADAAAGEEDSTDGCKPLQGGHAGDSVIELGSLLAAANSHEVVGASFAPRLRTGAAAKADDKV